MLLIILCAAGCGQSAPAPQTGSPDGEETLGDLLAKGEAVTGMSYDMMMKTTEYEMVGKVWLSGQNVKMEMEAEGQKVITIINAEKGEAYSYMPTQNMAIKIPFDTAGDGNTQNPRDFLFGIDQDMAEVGELVEYEGANCRLVTYQAGTVTTKLWLHAEYGVPVKVEVDDGGNVSTLEYKNLYVGDIPAETFDLPAGVNLVGN